MSTYTKIELLDPKVVDSVLHPATTADIVKLADDTSVQTHVNNFSHIPYVVSTGTTDTYALVLSPLITSYSDGLAIAVKFNVTNSGGFTLNVNNLGAKNAVDLKGQPSPSNTLSSNQIFTFRYSASTDCFYYQGVWSEASLTNSGLMGTSDKLSLNTAVSDINTMNAKLLNLNRKLRIGGII